MKSNKRRNRILSSVGTRLSGSSLLKARNTSSSTHGIRPMHNLRTLGNIRGPVSVDADLEIDGMVTGLLSVRSGARLLLTGTAEDLEVERGGQAIVYGSVSGTALNKGGYLEIRGMVGELEKTSASAKTVIRSGAFVSGTAY